MKLPDSQSDLELQREFEALRRSWEREDVAFPVGLILAGIACVIFAVLWE